MESYCAEAMEMRSNGKVLVQVTYFKRFRVAEYQKKKTLERLQKEGAASMGADSPVKR